MSLISIVFPIGVFCFAFFYWIAPAKLRTALLLLVSVAMYFYADRKGFLVLMAMIGFSYLFGMILENDKRKILLITAVICNLIPLFFFKVITFQRLYRLNIWNLVMPLGLSYYSFKSLSYLCDIYHEKIHAEKNVAKYALFVSFFPEIFIGPIDRASNLLRQINEKPAFQWDKIKSGAVLMAYGYFEKLVIADRLSIYVDKVYEDLWYSETASYVGIYTITAVIFYSLQIYFDFAGCTNIVRGVGAVLGFELPQNFQQPYLSVSVTEFWRKWHISLTSWLRDYIYIPLGGNRKGNPRKYINILVVFAVCAIWHGLGVHFLIWGILNAIFQILESLWKLLKQAVFEGQDDNRKDSAEFGKKLFKGTYTFTAISFTWIFFRAGNVGQALTVIRSMFAKWNPWVLFDESLYSIAFSHRNWYLLLFSLIIGFAVDILGHYGVRLREKIEKQGFVFQIILIWSLIFFTVLFGAYGNGYDAASFIYQNF